MLRQDMKPVKAFCTYDVCWMQRRTSLARSQATKSEQGGGCLMLREFTAGRCLTGTAS